VSFLCFCLVRVFGEAVVPGRLAVSPNVKRVSKMVEPGVPLMVTAGSFSGPPSPPFLNKPKSPFLLLPTGRCSWISPESSTHETKFQKAARPANRGRESLGDIQALHLPVPNFCRRMPYPCGRGRIVGGPFSLRPYLGSVPRKCPPPSHDISLLPI